MSDKLKATAAALRPYIEELRGTYNRNVSCRGSLEKRALRRKANEQLKLFVPLYRALSAAAQQAGAPDSKGTRCYKERVARLREYLHRTVAVMGREGLHRFDGAESVCLLIPLPDAQLSAGLQVTMAELLDLELQALAAERVARSQRARQADSTRAAFIASLDANQLAALKAALRAAREAGSYAVTFFDRDVGR